MKLHLCYAGVAFLAIWNCAAAEEPNGIWGPTTSNLQMSIMVRSDSPKFALEEINDPPGLIRRVKGQSDAVSVFLWKQLSEPEQRVLADLNAPSNLEAQSIMVGTLNRIISGPSIDDPERWRKVRTSGETLIALQGHPSGTNLVRANRLLLEEAYPLELARRIKNDGVRINQSEALVLTICFRNVSTNESYNIDMGVYIEGDNNIEFLVTLPTGEQIHPPPNPVHGHRGMSYMLAPGESVHFTYHFYEIFKFADVGRYTIAGKVLFNSMKEPEPDWITVESNPLTIQIPPTVSRDGRF